MNRLHMKYPQSIQEDSLASFLKKLPQITKPIDPCEFINHIDVVPERPRHYIKTHFQMRNHQMLSNRSSLPNLFENPNNTPKIVKLEQLQSFSSSRIPLPKAPETPRRNKYTLNDETPYEYKGSQSSRASPRKRVIFKGNIQVMDCGNGMITEQPMNDENFHKPLRRLRIKNQQTDFDQ